MTGTDTGYGPNSLTRIGQEITHFVEMGFTPLRGDRSRRPWSTPSCSGAEKSIGAVEVGFEADLIAVEQNPLEHVVTVRGSRCS